jgi:hypothetical protein
MAKVAAVSIYVMPRCRGAALPRTRMLILKF